PHAQTQWLAPKKDTTTRAVRKPSEPYIPKKLAASGVSKPRRDEKPRKAPARSGSPVSESGLPLRPSRPRTTGGKAVASRIPRRIGSAVSLRSGARRGRG